jgi:predicted HTH domain antitoxin
MGKKLEIAIKKYKNNEATASKAASIAGIPLTIFSDILASRGIEFHYGIEELREDIKNIEKYDI